MASYPFLSGLEYGGVDPSYNNSPIMANTIQNQTTSKGAKPAKPPKPIPYKASQKQPGYVRSVGNFSVNPGDPKYYEQIYDWGQGTKDKTGSFASPWYDPTTGMGYGDFNPKVTKANPNPQPTLNYSYNAPKPWTPPPPTNGGTTNTLPGGGSGLPPVTKVNSALGAWGGMANMPSPYTSTAPTQDTYDPSQNNQPGAPMPAPTAMRRKTGIGGVSPNTSSGFAF